MKSLNTQNVPARITMISHGSTEALRRAAFPLDEPLIDGEIEKISAKSWMPPRAQQIRCGPETRTQETARALGLMPSLLGELADVNYGNWKGRDLEDIQLDDPERLAEWLTDPNASPRGGESVVQLIARIRSWMMGQTTAGHVVAVTHPAVIRAAICHVLQTPAESFWKIEIAPLSLTDLRFNGRFWTVRTSGCSLQGI